MGIKYIHFIPQPVEKQSVWNRARQAAKTLEGNKQVNTA